jgi:hypothetical protein
MIDDCRGIAGKSPILSFVSGRNGIEISKGILAEGQAEGGYGVSLEPHKRKFLGFATALPGPVKFPSAYNSRQIGFPFG